MSTKTKKENKNITVLQCHPASNVKQELNVPVGCGLFDENYKMSEGLFCANAGRHAKRTATRLVSCAF